MMRLDEYLMTIAVAASLRSTCDRAHVGAVLARDGQIISTGYNGSVSGGAHCDDVGHFIVDGHCIRTVHAEMNAILQAAVHGTSTKGCTIYITHFPCVNCCKMLANSGVTEIVFLNDYGGNFGLTFLSETKIKLRQLKMDVTKLTELLNHPK